MDFRSASEGIQQSNLNATYIYRVSEGIGCKSPISAMKLSQRLASFGFNIGHISLESYLRNIPDVFVGITDFLV